MDRGAHESHHIVFAAALICQGSLHAADQPVGGHTVATGLSSPSVTIQLAPLAGPIAVSGALRAHELAIARVTAPGLQPQTAAAKSPTNHARTGTLIGLAAGTAAYALFFLNSNCQEGSDSAAALVAYCVLTGPAFIVSGALAGRAIGRSADKRAAAAP